MAKRSLLNSMRTVAIILEVKVVGVDVVCLGRGDFLGVRLYPSVSFLVTHFLWAGGGRRVSAHTRGRSDESMSGGGNASNGVPSMLEMTTIIMSRRTTLRLLLIG